MNSYRVEQANFIITNTKIGSRVSPTPTADLFSALDLVATGSGKLLVQTHKGTPGSPRKLQAAPTVL